MISAQWGEEKAMVRRHMLEVRTTRPTRRDRKFSLQGCAKELIVFLLKSGGSASVVNCLVVTSVRYLGRLASTTSLYNQNCRY